MSWKTASYIAWIVALAYCAGGCDSAGNPAVEIGGLVLPAQSSDAQHGSQAVFSPIPVRDATVGFGPGSPRLILPGDGGVYGAASAVGGGACSPYALAAYEDEAPKCGGVLSVRPSGKDRVVNFFRSGAGAGEPGPDSETAAPD